MNVQLHSDSCSGCSACYAICPVNAISMVADREGFLYPQIDEGKCIHCGLCQKACPFHADYPRSDGAGQISQQYYAVVHKDPQIQSTSRSGGAFAAMAQAILASGGSVYGVALDDDLQAYTTSITRSNQLPSLQGSKYVQSNKKDSFRQVRADLEAGRTVLFSGTGCEVSGLISYLRHCRVCMDQLYTCDLVCHGAPSPLIWKENLAQIQKRLGGKIDRVSFRDKHFGWHSHIESYQSGEKTLYANRYTSLFYSHVCLRPSCSNCKFCNYDRCSDITIGDFWGCEQLALSEDISKGISLLMINTSKGSKLLETLQGDLKCFCAEKAATFQPNLAKPSAPSANRETFWNRYYQHGYRRTASQYYSVINRLQLIYNLLFRRHC